MSDSVSDRRLEVVGMVERSAICNACMGSTATMREEGTTYLPIEAAESEKAWESRRDRSSFFPAFRKAIQTMVGKPFSYPITIGDDVPSQLRGWFENVDLTGRDLDTFSRDVFSQALIDGITWVAVDYPKVPQGATLEDENRMGARPYLIHIPLASMLGWRTETVGGRPVLTQVRWAEAVEVPDGEFGVKAENRVRVWGRGEVRTYSDTGNGLMFDPDLSGPVTLQEIPVVAVYTGRNGFWTATPPLEDLAWANVTHWQSSSDQRHVLHVARVPLLGADEDMRVNPAAPVVVGPDRLIVGLKGLRFVEHSGAAIAAGRQDLLDIEDQMRRMAGELLARTAGDKTATETSLEAMEGASQLKRWVWNFQDSMEEVLRLMAAWVGERQGGSIEIDTDWDDDALAADMLGALTSAAQSGLISKDTYLWNLQNAELLPPGRTIEDEKSMMDIEPPQSMPGSVL